MCQFVLSMIIIIIIAFKNELKLCKPSSIYRYILDTPLTYTCSLRVLDIHQRGLFNTFFLRENQ